MYQRKVTLPANVHHISKENGCRCVEINVRNGENEHVFIVTKWPHDEVKHRKKSLESIFRSVFDIDNTFRAIAWLDSPL